MELRHLYGYRDTDWTFNPAPHVDPEHAAAWPSRTVDVPSSHDAQLGELLDCYARGERPPSTSGDGGRLIPSANGRGLVGALVDSPWMILDVGLQS